MRIVVRDLKNIRDYIAEDNEEYAMKTIKGDFMVNLRTFRCFQELDRISPNESVFRTDYKYAIWEEYVILYKIGNEYVEIYRVIKPISRISQDFLIDNKIPKNPHTDTVENPDFTPKSYHKAVLEQS